MTTEPARLLLAALGPLTLLRLATHALGVNGPSAFALWAATGACRFLFRQARLRRGPLLLEERIDIRDGRDGHLVVAARPLLALASLFALAPPLGAGTTRVRHHRQPDHREQNVREIAHHQNGRHDDARQDGVLLAERLDV